MNTLNDLSIVAANVRKNSKRVLFTCDRANFDARELLHGVARHPATSGWILRVHACPQSYVQWSEWMDGFQPHGIIIFSPLTTAMHKNLRASNRPHVFLTWGIDPVQKQDCIFLPDEEAVGALAAEHFVDRRFKHIGVVSYGGFSHMASRKRGFLKVLNHLKSQIHVYDADMGKAPLKPYGEHIPEEFYQWLAHLPRPCGLFACDDEIGVVAIEACRHLNIKVPGEVAVLGAGNDGQACRIIAPRLSSVSVPFMEIGREAAGLLDRWMHGHPPKYGMHLLPPKEVVVRSSTEIIETSDTVVAKAIEYIATHFNKHLRVTDLHHHTGVSAKTLETRFKNELRRTPVEEIRRHRIERAKQLLRETNLGVNQIAAECGFKHAHKFSTAFKELTNDRPSDYRRRYHD